MHDLHDPPQSMSVSLLSCFPSLPVVGMSISKIILIGKSCVEFHSKLLVVKIASIQVS